MRAALRDGNPFNETGYQAAWPEIDQHLCEWKPDDQPQIEPGESDEYALDFFIEPTEEVVFVYGYLRNVEKSKGQELGWNVTAFYDLTGDGASG